MKITIKLKVPTNVLYDNHLTNLKNVRNLEDEIIVPKFAVDISDVAFR